MSLMPLRLPSNEPQSLSLSRHGQRPETQETQEKGPGDTCDLQHFGQSEPFARDSHAFGFIPPNLSMSKCSQRRSTQIEAVNTFQYFAFQTQAHARQSTYIMVCIHVALTVISASMYPEIAVYTHQTVKKR